MKTSEEESKSVEEEQQWFLRIEKEEEQERQRQEELERYEEMQAIANKKEADKQKELQRKKERKRLYDEKQKADKLARLEKKRQKPLEDLSKGVKALATDCFNEADGSINETQDPVEAHELIKRAQKTFENLTQKSSKEQIQLDMQEPWFKDLIANFQKVISFFRHHDMHE